jgi:hypothetical protein
MYASPGWSDFPNDNGFLNEGNAGLSGNSLIVGSVSKSDHSYN